MRTSFRRTVDQPRGERLSCRARASRERVREACGQGYSVVVLAQDEARARSGAATSGRQTWGHVRISGLGQLEVTGSVEVGDHLVGCGFELRAGDRPGLQN